MQGFAERPPVDPLPAEQVNIARIYDNEIDFVGRPAIDYFWYYPYHLDAARLGDALERLGNLFPELSGRLIADEIGRPIIFHQPGPLRGQVRSLDEDFVAPATKAHVARFVDRVFSRPSEPLFSLERIPFSLHRIRSS